MKAWDFDAVLLDGDVFCTECVPTGTKQDDCMPIFADSEWDVAPVCTSCGAEHDYMTILEPEVPRKAYEVTLRLEVAEDDLQPTAWDWNDIFRLGGCSLQKVSIRKAQDEETPVKEPARPTVKTDNYSFLVSFDRNVSDDVECAASNFRDVPLQIALRRQFIAELQDAYDACGVSGHFTVISETFDGETFPVLPPAKGGEIAEPSAAPTVTTDSTTIKCGGCGTTNLSRFTLWRMESRLYSLSMREGKVVSSFIDAIDASVPKLRAADPLARLNYKDAETLVSSDYVSCEDCGADTRLTPAQAMAIDW